MWELADQQGTAVYGGSGNPRADPNSPRIGETG